MNFRTQTVLRKGPFHVTIKHVTELNNAALILFTESLINPNVSLQRTCYSVCVEGKICSELAENAVEVDNTHGWGACVRCLEAQVDTECWYIEKARAQARAHKHTNTHKVSRVCHFSHGNFLRCLSCSNTHRVILKPVTVFIANRVTGSRLQTFSYTAVLVW